MIKRIFVAAMLVSGILCTVNAQTASTEKKAETDPKGAAVTTGVENGKKGNGEKIEKESVKEVELPAAKKPFVPRVTKKASSNSSKVWPKIIYYFPNRLIDITDVVTISAGFGPEFSSYLRCTNYMQAGGASGEKYYLTKGFHRQYGGAYSDGWNFGLLAFSKDSLFVDSTTGTVVAACYEKKDFGVPSFDNDYFTEKTGDFWATEVRLGWLLNFSVGVHPVEIADIITGIFLIDIMDDDFEDSALATVK